jgi:hypothetical protein
MEKARNIFSYNVTETSYSMGTRHFLLNRALFDSGDFSRFKSLVSPLEHCLLSPT